MYAERFGKYAGKCGILAGEFGKYAGRRGIRKRLAVLMNASLLCLILIQ